MTSREFHITALATATDWRCPPERLATAWRTERSVVTERLVSVSGRIASMLGSSSTTPERTRSRPRYMFGDDVEVVASARSWYTTSIPSFAASLGPWMWTGLPSKKTSPSSNG